MTVFHLGVNNCFAVKRWPMPADWAQICSSDLDINHVQFSFDLLDPRTSEPAISEMISLITDATRDAGLTIHSTFTGRVAYSLNLLAHPSPGMRNDALDWYAKAIRATGRLGVGVTGGHMGALSYPDYKDTGRRRYLKGVLLENVQRLSHLAANEGLKMLLWEPMPILREPPCTIDDARRLMRIIGENSKVPVRLAIDTGHQCTIGVGKEDNDVYAWLRELALDSPVIHIQQTDGKGDRHWPFTEKYNKIGIVTPEKVIEAIEGSGAREVCLFLEIIHPFEAEEKQVLDDLKTSVEYWKENL